MMRRWTTVGGWLAVALWLAACGGDGGVVAPLADGGAVQADGGAAAADGGATLSDGGATLADGGTVDKAASCARPGEYGTGITMGFGRLDGTVRAVLLTTEVLKREAQCDRPNNDHIVLQVLAGGATYRMVVNIDVLIAEKRAALAPGGPWSEGWHAGANLDYVTTLGVHSTDFTGYPPLDLQQRVVDRLNLGARVSVYAFTDRNNTDSAHLIHRRTSGSPADGAIVLDPDVDGGLSTFLLFRFDSQTF